MANITLKNSSYYRSIV